MIIALLLCLLWPTRISSQDDDYYNYDYYYGDYYDYSGSGVGSGYYYYQPPGPPAAVVSKECPGLNENYDICSMWQYGDSKCSFIL